MGVLKVLLWAKLAILKAILFDKRPKYVIRNVSMFLVLFVLIYVSYLFFYHLIFKYLIVIEDIGSLLIDRLVSAGFLIFFILLIVSSFVTSLGSLFRSEETEYLFSTPVSVKTLFTGKFFDIVIFSSWTILIMALPILYSYAKIKYFGTLEYALAGITVLLPFVLIAASIGTILALLGILASKYVGIKTLIAGFFGIFAGLIYVVLAFSQPTQLEIQFTEDFRALNLFLNNFNINSNPFTPNFWLIQCLRALVLNDYREFLLYSFALISSALFFVSLLYTYVERFYFKTWLISAEKSRARKQKIISPAVSKDGFLSSPADSQTKSLVKKDIMLFLRDPGQWSQLLLILTLIALYFINLRYIPKDIEIEQWRTILFIMNFGFCGFVLATLAVRFIYPSISLEGHSFWVLGSSPLSTATLFKEKFIISFTAFFVIAELIGLVSSSLLNIEGLYRTLTFGGIFLMSIALSSISIGLGAAFPDFSERNPSKIVSSPGGILTIVISLIYIGFMITMLAIPAYKYTLYLVAGNAFPQSELTVSITLIVIINLIMIVAPLVIGAGSFSKREF
jgi:ABC-2 type transport system permease protein